MVKARFSRSAWRALAVVVGGLGGALLALRSVGIGPLSRDLHRRAAPALAHARLDRPAVLAAAADGACRAELERLSKEPERGLPAVDGPELRAQLFGRTKSVPVLFLSRPDADESNPEATALRDVLDGNPDYRELAKVVGKVHGRPALARAVFLHEGYLYTENPELVPLYGALTLSLLFQDPNLRIVRGGEELFARRLPDGDYEYENGPELGRRAKLLLFDRIAPVGATLPPERHVDLRRLAATLGFDELELRHATSSFLIVDALYGQLRVPTLLHLEPGGVSLSCEIAGKQRVQLTALREAARRAERAQSRLLAIVNEQVDEALPFDEPKTEDGQQDGSLRPEWRQAYLNGSSSFEFNGDKYAVFDGNGRPRPPQVCIDFVLDTFERASGTWWQDRSKPRARVQGRLQFDDAAMANRRSVERFIDFARSRAGDFDVYELPTEARVPLRNRQQFFSALYKDRTQFRRGDIVAILGPRDDEKLHYHSFIIVDADPLTGLPIAVAANAGRPRIRSWEAEMASAPRRTIVARVRPRQLWLESFLSLDQDYGAGTALPGSPAQAPAPGPLSEPGATPKRPAAG